MTTAANLYGSLTTLEGALATAGIRVAPSPGRMAPPCAIVGGPPGPWFDLTTIGLGRMLVIWRILLVGGRLDNDAARDELVVLAAVAVDALRNLAGYRIGDVGRFGQSDIGGALYLAADMTVQTQVAIEEDLPT